MQKGQAQQLALINIYTKDKAQQHTIQQAKNIYILLLYIN